MTSEAAYDFCAVVSGRWVQSVRRSPFDSLTRMMRSVSVDSDAVENPTKPAASCVSNKRRGTVPQAYSSTSRS